MYPKQWRLVTVAAALLLLLSASIVERVSAAEPTPALPAWSYKCVNSVCAKVQAAGAPDDAAASASAANHVSLAVCRLLCGPSPGTVWPKVHGTIDFHGGHQLVAIDPAQIELQADAAVAKHDTFWPQNRDRFERQLRVKTPTPSARGCGQPLRIRVVVAQPEETKIWLQTDESYRIDGKEVKGQEGDGGGAVEVLINATTIFGARHGLETLAQLIVFDDFRNKWLMPAEIVVSDAPVFRHRGLLLDTARNYYSVDSLKRLIGEC